VQWPAPCEARSGHFDGVSPRQSDLHFVSMAPQTGARADDHIPMTIPVAFVLPSFVGGGAERVMLSIAGALNPDKFSPHVIVLDDAGPWRSLVPPAIPITNLNRPRLRQALWPLRSAIWNARPAVVLSTIGYLNLGLLLLKPFLPPSTKMIVREANTPRSNGRSMPGRFAYRLLYKFLYPRAGLVISPSTAIAEELWRDFGVPADLIGIVYNPVDSASLRAAVTDARRHPGQGRRFVAVGRLSTQKGFDRLIDAMRGVPDGHLTILGEGPQRSMLEKRINDRGLQGHVSVPGFDPSAASWIAGADALLLSSRWEGLPNVALEALACGTPVIATPESGAIAEIRALARDGAVIIAEMGEKFIEAMKNAAMAPISNLRPSMLPEAFELNRVVARFESLLETICSGAST